MGTLHTADTQHFDTTSYPEMVSEIKSSINPQALLWALIAVVLYIIYHQQADKGSTLGIIQLTIIIVSVLMAVIKLLVGNHKLIYISTGSPIVREERYYNLVIESDIRQCLHEGNISRLNALRTDDAGGIMVEILVSKDKTFTAMRMQNYFLEGYRPETAWKVMPQVKIGNVKSILMN